MTLITRRTLLTGAAATAAAAALGPIGSLTGAIADEGKQTCDQREQQDPELRTFRELSAILTGIDADHLMPLADPVADTKCQYLDHAKAVATFKALLTKFESGKQNADPNDQELAGLAESILNDSEVGNLARSIMLAWYLGAWYAPEEIAKYRGGNPPKDHPSPSFRVISTDSYTQGWVWRVAQAHPMGYSNLRFGYWGNAPLSPQFDPVQFMIGGRKS